MNWAQQVKDYYNEATTRLIANHCDELRPGTFQLDIVHEYVAAILVYTENTSLILNLVLLTLRIRSLLHKCSTSLSRRAKIAS